MVLIVIAFAVWVFIVVSVILDVARRPDLDGAATALWILLVVFAPLIGVVAYLIARPSVAPDEQADVEAYDAKVVPDGEAAAAAIADLTRRYAEGSISKEEYERRRRALEAPE